MDICQVFSHFHHLPYLLHLLSLHLHTHSAATHAGVTLSPWGRTVFNCSSALFSDKQGIKDRRSGRETRREVEKLAPGRIEHTREEGGEYKTGEERKPRHVSNCFRGRWRNNEANTFSNLINSSMMNIPRLSPTVLWIIVLRTCLVWFQWEYSCSDILLTIWWVTVEWYAI